MNPRVLAPLLLVMAAAVAAGDTAVKVVRPEEAAKKIDETVTVQMDVQSSTKRGKICLLNSEKDYKDAKNFTVFLPRETVAKLRKAKVDLPADYYKGKTIQVTGKVILYRGKPQIKVDEPGQIKVVENK